MGTLGKALGGFGAYVAGSRALVDLLAQPRPQLRLHHRRCPSRVGRRRARRPRLVATSPSAARALAAQRRQRCATGMRALGLAGDGDTHIVPVMLGDDPRRAMAPRDALLERGVFAQGIRPPTVPPGTARLRVTPMATHTDAQIDRALAAFADAARPTSPA